MFDLERGSRSPFCSLLSASVCTPTDTYLAHDLRECLHRNMILCSLSPTAPVQQPIQCINDHYSNSSMIIHDTSFSRIIFLTSYSFPIRVILLQTFQLVGPHLTAHKISHFSHCLFMRNYHLSLEK